MISTPNTRWLASEFAPDFDKKLACAQKLAAVGNLWRELWPQAASRPDAPSLLAAKAEIDTGLLGNLRRPGKKQNYIKVGQLKKIANALLLPRYFGENSWELLTNEFSFEDFEAKLLTYGYGNGGSHHAGPLTARERLLARLRSAGLSIQGLDIVPARKMEDLEPSHSRGGVQDEDDYLFESAITLICPKFHFSLRVDARFSPHLVILFISDGGDRDLPRIQVISPSYRSPKEQLSPHRYIPTTPDQNGFAGLQMKSDPGRVDVIGVLSYNEPISVPVSPLGTSRRFQVFETIGQLHEFESVIADLNKKAIADPSVRPPQLLHLPLLVHANPKQV